MSEIPTFRSYPQHLGTIVDAFRSEQAVKELAIGNPLLSIFEAAAQSDMRVSYSLFELLNAIALDSATGVALERIGKEEGVLRLEQSPATGVVDITDSSFTKLSTRIFQGAAAPIVGSTTLRVTDAADWPASGSLYIGRGTANYEGPLTYSAKTDQTTYWEITLSQATTKQHNVGESVVLAQGGNRTIGVGTIVKTPQDSTVDSVSFKTVYQVQIADGETSVTSVWVECEKPGVIGNVPAKAISQFGTEPFTGATIQNSLPLSNGQETETYDSYRDRIRKARKTRAKGTELAVTQSIVGINAQDENKRLTSASIVSYAGSPSTVFIDDGTGYEERRSGTATEVLVDSALGGEDKFQVKNRPIAKAFLLSYNTAPFALQSGQGISIRVGGTTYSHYFDDDEFATISSASAAEVVASINSDTSIEFFARTSDSGTRVVLIAKNAVNEDLQLVGGTAADAFRFPAAAAYSVQLYKNDRLLSKDGRPAVYRSELFGDWDAIVGNQTLQLAIDGTPPLTFTFFDQDFVDADCGYTVISNNSLEAWATVINNKIPGITASVDAGALALTSNGGAKANSSIEVTGGTLVAVRMFEVGTETGKARDYTVDRNRGQIKLEQPLVAGDRLSIGSSYTRAFLESAVIAPVTTAAPSSAWFSVDGGATRIPCGLSNTTLITTTIQGTHDWGRRLRIATTTPVFLEVQAGDWMIWWDTTIAALVGNWRVADVDPFGTWVVIERQATMMARAGHRVVTMAPESNLLGTVMAIGGYTRAQEVELNQLVKGVTAGCEIYDPNTRTTALCASLSVPRAYHTATLLNSGKILVTGGVSLNNEYLASTEIYDPATGTWSAGPDLPEAVAHAQAVKLSTGDVFICGGYRRGVSDVYSTMACRYNAVANTITDFTATAPIGERAQHRICALSDDRVLIAGGTNGTTLSSCQIYDLTGPSATEVAPMIAARRDFGLANYSNTPIAVGNHRNLLNQTTYEEYNVGTDQWAGGQIDATKYVHFDSKELIQNSDGLPFAPCCWYEENGVKVRKTYYFFSGAWYSMDPAPGNTDTHTHYEKRWAVTKTASGSTKNVLVGIGGLNATNFTPVAQVELLYTGLNLWRTADIDAALVTNRALTNPPGVAFVRTLEPLQQLTLPTGSDYTASSLASFLNGSLRGATASVYKTTKLRVATNTYNTTGDISLVAADATAAGALGIAPTATPISNLVGHMASVESGGAEFGTPNFKPIDLAGLIAEPDQDFWGAAQTRSSYISGANQLVGLRSFWSGPPTSSHKRASDNLHSGQRLGALTISRDPLDGGVIDERTAPADSRHLPGERFYAAAPWAIGPNHDLSVIVDEDSNKRFNVKLWRTLTPTTGTYGISNAFVDGDAGGASLATTFGLTYSFDDCAVYMKARALAFSSEVGRRCLFRYFRLGPEGNYARVRIANPLGPSTSTTIAVDNFGAKTGIRIVLPGGAARSPSIRSTTKIGYVCTAVTGGVGTLVFALGFPVTEAVRSVAGDPIRLTIELPTGITSSGLLANMMIYLKSTSEDFPTKAYTVTSTSAGPGNTQYVFVADPSGTALVTANNIGTLSYDSMGEATFAGANVTIGDFLRISSGASIATLLEENTFRITTVADQHVICSSGELDCTLIPPATSLSIGALLAIENLEIFAAESKTVTQLAAIVNGEAAKENSLCPITMTVTGSGAGAVVQCTPDELGSQIWYDLADGVNWVSKTTLPGTIQDNYTLSFKKPITGSLAVNSDWLNESIQIVPITTTNLVNWLQSPAISSLNAACRIEGSTDGRKLQLASRTPGAAGSIQILGGLANSSTAEVKGETVDAGGIGVSTIPRSYAEGLSADMWVSIDNTISQPKCMMSDALELTSWSSDGLMTFDRAVYTVRQSPVNAKLNFEKQGDFVAISGMGLDQFSFSVAQVSRTAQGLYTLTLRIPNGLTSCGWEMGDVISYTSQTVHEIVRAESRAGGDQDYLYDLLLKDGATTSSYVPGDTFEVFSSNANFPAGIYTVTTVTPQANNTERVECTLGAVASPITAEFSIGTAVRQDSVFTAGTFEVVSVGPYNQLSATQTVTYNSTAGSPTSRYNLGSATTSLNWTRFSEGDWLRITDVTTASTEWTDKQVPVQNQGIFRVVRSSGCDVPTRPGTIWIENAGVVEGAYETRVAGYSYQSMMPNDVLSINTTKWGRDNVGSWVIEKVGVNSAQSTSQFRYSNRIKVSLINRIPTAVGAVSALGAENSLVQLIEAKPGRLIKKIEGISPSQTNGDYLDVRWDTVDQVNQISAGAGSVITALDKLDFSTNLACGIDGYSHHTGLIALANKIIYGEPRDSINYPGVAAAAAQIDIQGAPVRRVKVALQIRVVTGASLVAISNRVKSAVATVINQAPIGQSIALSALEAAAQKVAGVVAVAILSPVFTSDSDRIAVQSFEKPRVINLDTDIIVTFISE